MCLSRARSVPELCSLPCCTAPPLEQQRHARDSLVDAGPFRLAASAGLPEQSSSRSNLARPALLSRSLSPSFFAVQPRSNGPACAQKQGLHLGIHACQLARTSGAAIGTYGTVALARARRARRRRTRSQGKQPRPAPSHKRSPLLSDACIAHLYQSASHALWQPPNHASLCDTSAPPQQHTGCRAALACAPAGRSSSFEQRRQQRRRRRPGGAWSPAAPRTTADRRAIATCCRHARAAPIRSSSAPATPPSCRPPRRRGRRGWGWTRRAGRTPAAALLARGRSC